MVAERGKAPVPAAQVGGLDSSTVPPGYGREATAKGPVPLHEPDSREGTQVGSLRLRTGENPRLVSEGCYQYIGTIPKHLQHYRRESSHVRGGSERQEAHRLVRIPHTMTTAVAAV